MRLRLLIAYFGIYAAGYSTGFDNALLKWGVWLIGVGVATYILEPVIDHFNDQRKEMR